MNKEMTFEEFIDEVANRKGLCLTPAQRKMLKMIAEGQRLYIDIPRHMQGNRMLKIKGDYRHE